ncbi:MAG: hypothetical protein ACJAV3_000369 [Alcanivorax sp.]|jgi:hypothetical protein
MGDKAIFPINITSAFGSAGLMPMIILIPNLGDARLSVDR